MFGDYDTLSKAIRSRSVDILDRSSYETLIRCGTILGASGDLRAEEFFTRAAVVASDTSEAYGATHRLSAFLIKRAKSLEEGVEVLEHAKAKYLDTASCSSNERSNPVVSVDLALLYNLEALAFLDEDTDTSRAWLSLKESRKELTIAAKTANRSLASRIQRYYSQVQINWAQLQYLDGDLVGMCETLRNNVVFAKKQNSDYLPEAVGALAYGEYLSHNYVRALIDSVQAFALSYRLGDLTALVTLRKIIVGVFAALDRTDVAEEVASTIDKDPLGIGGPLPADLSLSDFITCL